MAPKPVNPFWVGEANWGGHGLFLDRTEVLTKLDEHSKDEGLFAVVLGGPRRIGKTSVLRRLEQYWRPTVPVVFESVRDISHSEPMSHGDLAALCVSIDDQLALAGLWPEGEPATSFSEISVKWQRRCAAEEPPRVCILIDETELLHQRDPQLVVDLLRCFRLSGTRQPAFLVLGWGRWLGSLGSAVTGILKDTPQYDLGPIEEPHLKRDMHRVFQDAGMQLSEAASDQLWNLSQGHPFYAMAVARILYDSHDPALPSIEAEAMTTGLLAKAASVIEPGLRHSWDQIHSLQHALCWSIARLAVPQGSPADFGDLARRGFTLTRVAEFIAEEGLQSVDVTSLRSVVRGLEHSFVIESAGDKNGQQTWRIRSPFLAAWLAASSFSALDPDTRNVEEGSGRSAAELFEEAFQAVERKDDEAAAALLARALLLAPFHPEILIEAARVARRRGALDEAATLLRGARIRGDVTCVQWELAEVLEQRILAAIASEDDPRTLWSEYRDVVRIAPREIAPGAVRGVIDAFAGIWREQLDDGRLHDALTTLRNLERDARGPLSLLPGWRARFLWHYASLMRSYRRSDAQLTTCLTAIRHGLLPLTEETIAGSYVPDPEESVANLPEEVRAAIGDLAPDARVFGDLPSTFRALINTVLTRSAEGGIHGEWEATLEVLEAVCLRRHVTLPDALGASDLQLVLSRAPLRVADAMRGLLSGHLARFVADDVRTGSERAAELCDLLLEVSADKAESALVSVLDAAEERVFSLDEADREQVEQSFRVLPFLLRRLLNRNDTEADAPLSPEDLLELAELVTSRVHRGDGKASWEIVAKQPAAAREWSELVDVAGKALADADPSTEHPQARVSELLEQLRLPEDLVALTALDPEREDADRYAGDSALRVAKRLLNPDFYAVSHLLKSGNQAGTHHLVWRFAGKWRKDPHHPFTDAHFKLYRQPNDDPQLREFLETLWSHERRVLFEVGSRRGGRSLAALLSSELHSDEGYLLLVTEPVGQVSLRDLLDNRRASSWKRDRPLVLWRELLGLMNGLQSLHQARYMHRNLRPESIRVRFDDGAPDGVFRFKLVDFEWSIYLHSTLADESGRRRHRDYYCAPEVLAVELGLVDDGDTIRGEAFSSDLYALGLVMFELMVRPLRPDELGEFLHRRAYSRQAHIEFIDGLRREILDRKHGLSTGTQLLLLGLIRFEANKRSMTLHSAIAQVRLLAIGSEELQNDLETHQLPAVATLEPECSDSIAGYIERYPGVKERLEDIEQTRRFIEKQLFGARVYENATSTDRPLFIEGRQVNFTATPFQRDRGEATFPKLAYLWVARKIDSPEHAPLARLKAGVKMINLRPRGESSAHLQQGDDRWEMLFNLAGDVDEAASMAERQAQGLLHRALGLTAEAEVDLLDQQIVAYEIIKGPSPAPGGNYETVLIGPRPTTAEEEADTNGRWREGLRRNIAQLTQLEGPNFELCLRQNITDWIQEDMIWQVQEVDSESESVLLARSARGDPPAPPQIGYVRPPGITGVQSLISRRRRLLRRIQTDRHILHAISDPLAAHQRVQGPEIEFFQADLDEDKRRIVSKVRSDAPMVLVQGPPGTGKTTLAAEVVLQTLAESGSARVLVTAQGHDPLNHLMASVNKQIKAHRPTRKKAGRLSEVMLVRLVPERRLTTTADLGGVGREVEMTFHPSQVAREMLQRSLRWCPEDDDLSLDPALVAAWEQFVDEQLAWDIPYELQQRVTNSANVVCATANDRTLEQEFRFDRPFDLLIYEEAGRALPLELIGPMTNAPRWLMIGDYLQLPPHQATDLGRILHRQLQDDAEKGATLGTNALSERRQKAIEILLLFRHLWKIDQHRVYTDELKTQYRMHPAISDALSETYYDGNLLCADPVEMRQNRRHRIIRPSEAEGKAMIWIDLPWVRDRGVEPWLGEEPASGGGYTNHAEVHAIQRFLSSPYFKMRGKGFRPGEMVFLSPYRAQVERFRQVFRSWRSPETGLLTDVAYTVDSFQGREAEVVIVSLVRNNNSPSSRSALGFLEHPSRSVVMFSRAQRLLVVVGCSRHFEAVERERSPIRRFLEQFRESEQQGEALMLRATELFDEYSYPGMEGHWQRRNWARRTRGAGMYE